MQEPLQNDPRASEAAAVQEIDAWWGAYSGLAMLPSTLVCLGLSAGILWAVWFLADPAHVTWISAALLAGLWLVQLVIGLSHVFATHYRLTTRRMLVLRGHFWQRRRQIELKNIVSVTVRRHPARLGLDIGSIVITGTLTERLTLDGVRQPEQIAARIRTLAHIVQEGAAPVANVPAPVGGLSG